MRAAILAIFIFCLQAVGYVYAEEIESLTAEAELSVIEEHFERIEDYANKNDLYQNTKTTIEKFKHKISTGKERIRKGIKDTLDHVRDFVTNVGSTTDSSNAVDDYKQFSKSRESATNHSDMIAPSSDRSIFKDHDIYQIDNKRKTFKLWASFKMVTEGGNTAPVTINLQNTTPGTIKSTSWTFALKGASVIEGFRSKTFSDAWATSLTITTPGTYIITMETADTNGKHGLVQKSITVATNVVAVCSPGKIESTACLVNNGVGEKYRTCLSNGSGWSEYEGCTPVSCNAGYKPDYTLSGGTCEKVVPVQICTPNKKETAPCTISNGVGERSRTCLSDGLSWSEYGGCATVSCNTGYTPKGGICEKIAPVQICTPNKKETASCTISNGVGERSRTCHSDGLSWSEYGGCTTISCNTGYILNGGTCKKVESVQICTPKEKKTVSCTINRGSGVQDFQCTSDGKSWVNKGSCEVVSCDSGYLQHGTRQECIFCKKVTTGTAKVNPACKNAIKPGSKRSGGSSGGTDGNTDNPSTPSSSRLCADNAGNFVNTCKGNKCNPGIGNNFLCILPSGGDGVRWGECRSAGNGVTWKETCH